jgi:hypothetical protein
LLFTRPYSASALIAFVHHLAAFALAAVSLQNSPCSIATCLGQSEDSRADMAYGISAGVLLVAGLLRVSISSGKCILFQNVFFIAKLSSSSSSHCSRYTQPCCLRHGTNSSRQAYFSTYGRSVPTSAPSHSLGIVRDRWNPSLCSAYGSRDRQYQMTPYGMSYFIPTALKLMRAETLAESVAERMVSQWTH